jgi:hypothetical protein
MTFRKSKLPIQVIPEATDWHLSKITAPVFADKNFNLIHPIPFGILK